MNEPAQAKAAEKIGKVQNSDIHDIPINYNSQWKEIIRIMNTQKAVTTVSQNRYDEVIISHRCSDPTPKVEAIYRRLKYKPKPNTNQNFNKWIMLICTFFRLDQLQNGLTNQGTQ